MGDKNSWSFISEDSFTAIQQHDDLPLHGLGDDWDSQYSYSDDGSQIDLAADVQAVRFQQDMQSYETESSTWRTPSQFGIGFPPQQLPLPYPVPASRKASQYHSHRHNRSTPKRKRTVTFKEDIPVVARTSSAPPSIQLLQEAPVRPRARAATAPSNFFNHTLYGSLRSGLSVELFSKEFYGLAFSAAAGGFLDSFAENCFYPLLYVYLGLNNRQIDATYHYLRVPRMFSFFIGVLSDFYPLWGFHRKAYMFGGWVLAYFMLMALVVVAVIDDQTQFVADSVRTWNGGIVYILLTIAMQLGVTFASVAAFAFMVELSQREPIHERGTLVIKYLTVQETFRFLADTMSSLVLDYKKNTTGSVKSAVSMKVVVLIMALVALIPIPAVLFRLDEDQRQIKVDSVDRSSLRKQFWTILQQDAVWRVVLFICLTYLLSSFELEFVSDAVYKWSSITLNLKQVFQIPFQAMVVIALIIWRYWRLNCDWKHLALGGVAISIGSHACAALPVVYNGVRAPWYFILTYSISGFAQAAMLIVTTLPVIEITENCIEGATSGLVISFISLIQSVILSISDAMGDSMDGKGQTFSSASIKSDTSEVRTKVLEFLVLNYCINLLALVPILYLLPRQKLDVQQLRAYGEHKRVAGIVLCLLFIALLAYAAAINIWSLSTN